MQSEAAEDQSEPIGEAEYQTLAQTLLESDRGRRFLGEYLRRNKTPETQEILSAIKRLEKTVGQGTSVPNVDTIKLDIADMAEAIDRTKSEIANIKAEEEDSNRFVNASSELDAIVKHTEAATQTILEAAEAIQEQAWTMREQGAADELCDVIDEKATEIFMACSFQDLTGQRTNKVVQVLSYLESRINYMIGLWGISEVSAEDVAAPEDVRPDAHLLNGPQMEGEGVSQDNVDELMSVSSDVFDAALEDAAGGETETSEVDMEAPMDASDIDDMFASAPAETEDTEATPEAEAVETDAAESVAEESEPAPQEAEPEFAAASDDILDESEIDKLFDAETQGAEAADAPETDETVESEEVDVDALIAAEPEEASAEAASEEEADADWEQTAVEASTDEADPLEKLSESERQALFN